MSNLGGAGMQNCKITIISRTDGKETKTLRDGKIEISEGKILLAYAEENASTTMLLEGDGAKIRREGDYTLYLDLKNGETLEGTLGIGGSSGAILVKTRHVAYSVKQHSLLLNLQYELLFGEGTQTMSLRIRANF